MRGAMGEGGEGDVVGPRGGQGDGVGDGVGARGEGG